MFHPLQDGAREQILSPYWVSKNLLHVNFLCISLPYNLKETKIRQKRIIKLIGLPMRLPQLPEEVWKKKKIPPRVKRHPTPVLLTGESHGQRSLVGCNPWGREDSDTTERLYFHFSLACNGEGNSNPLQCSCLENPRDDRAWWAAVYGVAQSWTRLKRLSSSSSRVKRDYA